MRSSQLYLYLCLAGCTLVLTISSGCEDPGIELQLKLPSEPTKQVHLEVTIDGKSGISPTKIASRVYAIEFPESGKAVINSPWVLRQWRREFIVTPTRKLDMIDDYETVDSGWKMATITEKLPGGGVKSSSTEQGSKFWMDLKIKDHAILEPKDAKPDPKER